MLSPSSVDDYGYRTLVLILPNELNKIWASVRQKLISVLDKIRIQNLEADKPLFLQLDYRRSPPLSA